MLCVEGMESGIGRAIGVDISKCFVKVDKGEEDEENCSSKCYCKWSMRVA